MKQHTQGAIEAISPRYNEEQNVLTDEKDGNRWWEQIMRRKRRENKRENGV
jgi:hypothetical protein